MKNITPQLYNRHGLRAAVLAACLALPLSSFASTLAFWTFEGDGTNAVTDGTFVMDTDGRTGMPGTGILVKDISGNGNSLFTWNDDATGHQYRPNVPAQVVPKTGEPNHFSIQNNGNFPATMTWSLQSKPSADLETIEPLQWTIEASIYQTANAANATIVGRDGNGEAGFIPAERAPLYFQTTAQVLAIRFTDVLGTQYDLTDTTGPITLNKWYNVAATSDGTTLRLYKDSGAGYQLVGELALTSLDTRLNYDSEGSSTVGDTNWSWSIGRGRWSASNSQFDGHTDRFFGFIDNVRISDVALVPSEFLGYSANPYIVSGPSPASQIVALGSPATFTIVAGGESLTYQWRKEGQNISGANQATYTIPATTALSAGNYDVIVANSSISVTSTVATLAIHTPRTLTWGGISSIWDTTSPNWTTDDGATFLSYFETDNVRFTSLGQGQPLVTFTNAHIPSSVLVSGASYTLAGSINSLGGLTLDNNASLVLSNSSSFAATTLSSGKLSLRATNSLGALTVAGGSTLQVNGNSQAAASLAGAGVISTTNGTPILTFGANSQDTAWSGSITNEGGAISFIKVGSGTATFTGSNYFAGTAASQVNGGGLVLGTGSAIVPQGTGEFWVSEGANTGRVEVAGGYLGVNNWLVVGRNNSAANGTMILNSGTVQKTGGGNVVIGSLGATGTLIVNGGQLLNNANIWVGENATADATLKVNGGLVQATQIRYQGAKPANSLVYFNGGTLQATAASADFMTADLGVLISAGGLTLDNNGYDLSINAILSDDFKTPSTGGSFTKIGAGSTRLVGGYTHTGATIVKGGNLTFVSTGYYGSSPDLIVSNASITLPGNLTLNANNVRLGDAAVVNIDFGTLLGNPTYPVLAATGTLLAPGATVTINIAGAGLQIGTVPLITYAGTTLPNISNFVLGQLPPGVTATLANHANSLDLVVSATGQSLTWYGDVSDVWNINGAANWLNLGVPGAKYLEYGPVGDPVVFDDNAQRYTVNLTTSVHPFTMVVNSVGDYTIAGTGGITGSTAIVKTNTGTLTLGTANSHTGGTYVGAGTLVVSNNAALGSPEVPVTLNGGSLKLANQTVLATRPVAVTAVSTIAVPEGATATVGGDIRGNAALRKVDLGTLNVTGTNSITAAFDVQLGTVNFSGTNIAALATPAYMGVGSSSGTSTVNLLPGAVLNRFEVKLGNQTGAKGVLNMTNATLVTGGGEIWVGGSADNINTEGEFNVVNSSVVVSNWTAIGRSFGTGVSKGVLNLISGTWTNRGANNFVLASAANNTGIANVMSGGLLVSANQLWAGEAGNGILNIDGGTVLAARTANPALVAGRAGNGAGSIRLRSGVLDSADQTYLGHGTGSTGSYGELDQSGGTAVSRWYFVVARNNDRAIYRQTGGAFYITNRFMTVGAGGTGSIGVADLSGGSYTSFDNADGGIYVGENGTGTVNIRGNAVVTMGGTATAGGVRIGGNAGASGILNLSGGVLNANRIFRNNTGASAVMNFDGGVLKAVVNTTNYISNLNSAQVRAGGAIIDDNGLAITIPQALVAPSDKGITSIALTSGGSGYIGAPVIVISGGTGTNGTAVANMVDDGTGRGTYSVASITITSPGNYSADPTTVAFLGGGQNVTVAVAGAITTAANTSGGLVKLGTGTTTLNGANTYTGLTTISNGTLNVQGSVAGAVLVKGGAALGGSGAIAGVVTVEDTATIGAGTNSIGTITLAAPPVLSANSTVVAEVNRNDGVATLADRINVAGPIAYNGRLVLKNAGALLQPGDKFKLFDATSYTGSFTIVSQTFAQTVTWDTSSLGLDGTVTVASVSNVPYTLGANLAGNKLTLSWPADMIGARLMTNAVSLSDTNAWFAYPGSASMTSLDITIDPAKTNVYYRLVYP